MNEKACCGALEELMVAFELLPGCTFWLRSVEIVTEGWASFVRGSSKVTLNYCPFCGQDLREDGDG